MNKKEFKHLNRAELLELLLEQTLENEQLKKQLRKAQGELAERRIRIEAAGNLPQLVVLSHKAVGDDYASKLLTLIPKCSVKERPETVSMKVLKVWDDEGNEASRPEEITVHLLKN